MRLIDEETERHECDLPVKFEKDSVLIRDRKGFWRRHHVPESIIQRLGEIPEEMRVPTVVVSQPPQMEHPIVATPKTKQNRTHQH